MTTQAEALTLATMTSQAQLVSCNRAPKPNSSPDWPALLSIWSHLLSRIQQPPDIAAVRRSCQSLCDYMDEQVKTLSIKQLNRISHQWARNLQSLTVSSDSDLSLLALCTNLQSLSLKSTPASVTALSTLTSLTSLELTPSQWDSLDLLSTCTRLQHLQLSGLKHCWLHHLDISALLALSNLTSLHMLAGNSECPEHTESPAEPLYSLLNVQHLNLRAASINNVMPLRHLTQLTSLVISRTLVSSLLPLSGCALLAHLGCASCSRLQSIAGLEACPSLRNLIIGGTPISDLSPLSSCSALVQLDAISTPVIDIRAIAACTGIVRFNISSTRLTDISVVSSLSNLRTMLIWFTPVTDIAPLAACTQLEQLETLGSHVQDLSPVSALSSLTAFRYGDRQPPPAGSAPLNLEPLRSCKQLRELDLSGSRIHSSNFLTPTQLVKLQLAFAKVRHLKALQACHALTHINLHRCPIRSLRPLAACTNLQTLYTCDLKVCSLDGLQHCHNLQTLTITNCPLSDIDTLAACRNLQHLNLASTQVKTILVLKHCTALQSVDISDTRVWDVAPLAACPHLKNLAITDGWLHDLSMLPTSVQVQIVQKYPKFKSDDEDSLLGDFALGTMANTILCVYASVLIGRRLLPPFQAVVALIVSMAAWTPALACKEFADSHRTELNVMTVLLFWLPMFRIIALERVIGLVTCIVLLTVATKAALAIKKWLRRT